MTLPSIPVLFAAAILAVQSAWTEIGKTSSGNSVFVNSKSIKRANGIITARVRVKYGEPVKTPSGTWATSQATAMFDCAKNAFAVKESVYYIDEKTNRIAERKTNAIPGYGPAIKGTFPDVALTYLCKK